MSNYIRGHLNLFGGWDSRFTPKDVKERKKGSEIFADLIEMMLEDKIENLDLIEIERFAELSTPELYIPIVPDEPKFIDRLARPLKSAKRLYCFGEYLSTIALCGLVGESLTMLIYRIYKFEINKKIIDKKQEEQLFGREFDNLDQYRRINVLKGLGLISEEQHQMFSELRQLRRPYLHLWEVDTSNIQGDAKKSFIIATNLFKSVTRIGIGSKGELIMDPNLLNYIKAHQEAPVETRQA
ncbi:MAG: hypothetical protein HY447_01010 [Candidatus Omnitrophica bacterium]|nr:hypothetical protein [Candidatus Omnitrophota bacterium]